jgi:hypothetical protein
VKLGQFLSKAPKPSAPAQRVEMTLCGMNADAHQVRAPAYATFQVVTEAKEQETGEPLHDPCLIFVKSGFAYSSYATCLPQSN